MIQLILAAMLFVILLGFVAAVFLGLTISTWTKAATITGLLGALAHAGVATWNPNRAAARRAGVAASRTGLTWTQVALLALASGALIPMTLAEAGRKSRGWELSPGVGVVGPGDEVRVTMPFSPVRTFGGLWNGKATPLLDLKPQPVAMLGLTATTNRDEWGSSIRTAPTRDIRPWAMLTIPANPALARRRLDLIMQFDLRYPYDNHDASRSATPTFSEGTREVSFPVELRLADPHARSTYQSIWSWTAIPAVLALAFAGVGSGLYDLMRASKQ